MGRDLIAFTDGTQRVTFGKGTRGRVGNANPVTSLGVHSLYYIM